MATTAQSEIRFAEGFYPPETDGGYEFRWVAPEARLCVTPAPGPRYLSFAVRSRFQDLSQELTCVSGSAAISTSLRSGWAPFSFQVPAGASQVDFAVNKPFPKAYYPLDDRTLAIEVRSIELHDRENDHRQLTLQQSNLIRNLKERHRGAARLDSTPIRLGIDMHGACNVKPPCVYCEWDHNKRLEGGFVDTPFTVETLREWGPFFENSAQLVNCSIGEPFMMMNLDELLDEFGAGRKEVEITTNGQILTERNIQRLVGRRIHLYVSLDAGTPETYAKLRNNRFEPIIRNLERLIAAKGGPGRYPYVWLVFMPMKVNVHELPIFVDLAERLRVDSVVLRPLNYADTKLSWDRAGYRFDYKEELLPFDELVRASGRAAALCERAGLSLADQMDFGGSRLTQEFRHWYEEGRQSARAPLDPPAPVRAPVPVAAAQEPPPVSDRAPQPEPPAEPLPPLGVESTVLCTEPWESLYILRRGVLPCCHGHAPIAPMDSWRHAWNSTVMQDIRRDLAAGRLHSYCEKSESCPIVRKVRQRQPPRPRTLVRRVRDKVLRTVRGLRTPIL